MYQYKKNMMVQLHLRTLCSAVFNMSTLSGARMELPIQLLCEDGIIEGVVITIQ